MFKKAPIRKSTAVVLFLSLLAELLTPLASYALTSGPSQPEMQSFEPVGTTDMVNAFSGDFTYNIPLLDVEGYPVNIAYHSGIGVEDEASWTGLGWNINPGSVNHGVRGLPDDFNGEMIEKELLIKPQTNKKFTLGASLEILGVEGTDLKKYIKQVSKKFSLPAPALNLGINLNNYTGVSSSLGYSVSGGVRNGWMSAGINMNANFSSNNGVDVGGGIYGGVHGDAAAGKDGSQTITGAINGSFGKSYNSREGLKYTSFGVGGGIYASEKGSNRSTQIVGSGLSNSTVPISSQNFVPVITNASSMTSKFYQLKVGFEFSGMMLSPVGSYRDDITEFDKNGERRGFGYFNLQNASRDDITDFTRDRDGRFNRSMKYLPSGSMTYDIYGVSGQGTAGNFRAFRNDIGSVYDPYTKSATNSRSHVGEIGFGNLFEAGYDFTEATTSAISGPWEAHQYPFSGKESGNPYEPHYFKQAGELTEASSKYSEAIGGPALLRTNSLQGLNKAPLKKRISTSDNPEEFWNRTKRSNQFYFFTASEAALKGVSLQKELESYSGSGPSRSVINLSRTSENRKAHHASEFTQILPDGRRYIYGLPAMNNKQIEYVLSCSANGAANGIVDVGPNNQNLKPYTDVLANSGGLGEGIYMKASTPAYAHNYLLTNVLSPDYSDLTGDGLTDDDLGNYTKFNYTRKEESYGWRAPYIKGKAQYDKGVASDCHDDKATFIGGSKEIWILHSIETKNYIAEFYTSAREDAKGAEDNVVGASGGISYKLDRIALYNKKEWANTQTVATPIKEIFFTYDYSLCHETPNSDAPTTKGKLTLKAISMKFGNSDIGMLSPYKFSYNGLNPNYNTAAKDRWGNYKEEGVNAITYANGGGITLPNHDFPYVVQNKVQADTNATAWNLTDIRLPSGGGIKVGYEADDYAYVQDRRAMEMLKVEGIGASTTFSASNELYRDANNPYLYIYFKRKGVSNEWFSDIKKSYLGDNNIIQYNFKVKMSSRGETTKSCGIPLEDHVKGYAKVVEIGNCPESGTLGYIKLEPKNIDAVPALKALDMGEVQLNPVTLAAIFYAKYYNNNALYPASEIVNLTDKALIVQLISSVMDLLNFFRNPIAQYLKESKAKSVDLNQSFIRLYSQGHKLGGGHRVKRIEFADNWGDLSTASNPKSIYGSEYDYSIKDPSTGKAISSGVASYEPLYGGDENPFKEPIATDNVGQNRDFPAVIPTELTMEGPIGESLFPGASVGYSKVTITSIHKGEGESSQTIQEEEFYTAKDFPVRITSGNLEVLEDKPLKTFDLSFNKEEAYRVGQSYALFFNDMHGKMKGQTTFVAKGGDTRRLVSYKKYNYFTNPDGTLNNTVPCITLEENQNMAFTEGPKTLGVETDMMIDNRAKDEYSESTGLSANLNAFLAGFIPIPIPTVLPHLPESVDKHFSSVVTTKVIQKYGILKSVETFDKGAAVVMTNEKFDANTGLALVTKVSTEHNDNEIQVKYPAYWAYRCMGSASHNILYEEDVNEVKVINDTVYIKADDHRSFNVGDELLVDYAGSCELPTSKQTRKLWVVDKTNKIPVATLCNCQVDPNQAVSYNIVTSCGSHSKTPTDATIPSVMENKYAYDNLCKVTREQSLMHEFIAPTDKSGYNESLNKILSNSILGNDPLNNRLSTLLLSSSNNSAYPIESFSANSVYNNAYGTYPPYRMYRMSNFPNLPPVYIGNIDRFGNHNAHSRYQVHRGKIGSKAIYTNTFQNMPIINESKKLVKVSLHFKSNDKICIGRTSQPNERIEFCDINNYNEDYDDIKNAYLYYKIDIYLPYDTSYSKCLTKSDIEAMNFEYKEYTPGFSWFHPVFYQKNDPPKKNNLFNYTYNPFTFYLNYAKVVKINDTTNAFQNTPGWSVAINNTSYDRIWSEDHMFVKSEAEIISRYDEQQYSFGQPTTLVAVPHDRKDISIQGDLLPENDLIQEAHIKVIRSGRRNQLLESVQNISLVSKSAFNYKSAPYAYPSSFDNVINMSAQTYTDKASLSEALADPFTDFYNPFVNGSRGTYRVDKQYDVRKSRDYAANTDVKKGLLNEVTPFWNLIPESLIAHKYIGSILPNPEAAPMWIARMAVSLFSPFGLPLQVQDAAGNIEATLYGYNNQLPTAKVINTSWDNVLFENFEDDLYTGPNRTLQFFQNLLHRSLYFGIGTFPNTTMSGLLVNSSAQKHTGQKSLQITGNISIPFPAYEATPANMPESATPSFHFRGGRKYLFSFWQKVDQNSFNPANLPLVSLSTVGSISAQPKPKTPPIDGWVLYEGTLNVPANANGNIVNLNFTPGFYDDLRILPVEANMKCFVYHPTTHKLAATLDENHMASLLEYDAEGKLVRIKKETERGILTIKESRNGVHSAFESGTSVDLKN